MVIGLCLCHSIFSIQVVSLSLKHASDHMLCACVSRTSVSAQISMRTAHPERTYKYSARIYRPSFCENKPKTLVFSHRKRAFWACFRENWVHKFGHWTFIVQNLSTVLFRHISRGKILGSGLLFSESDTDS
jgi:hypothetical protein